MYFSHVISKHAHVFTNSFRIVKFFLYVTVTQQSVYDQLLQIGYVYINEKVSPYIRHQQTLFKDAEEIRYIRKQYC
jgi:hypothetical protein